MKKFFLTLAMLSLIVMVVTPFMVGAYASTGATAAPIVLGGAGAAPSPGCSNLEAGGLKAVANCIISFFDIAIILMIAAAVVFVVYGAFLMISSEEKREAGRQTIYYGIIGIFIMISVWGFVNILKSTFSLTNTQVTPPSLLRV